MATDTGTTSRKLLMFGSLKGGAGKTTLSLLAVEALVARRQELIRDSKPCSAGVILIDADLVGTEASDVVGNEYVRHERSLAEIIGHVPTSRSVYASLHTEIETLKQVNSPRYLVASFNHELELKRPVWREVLEQSGLYVQRRMHDLVSVCRAHDLDVVVDLPAFDVGFAKGVRNAFAEDKSATMFFVTDCDVRSLIATQTYRAEATHKPRIVVNRIPNKKDDKGDDEYDTRLSGLFDGPDCVLVPEAEAVFKATRADEAGGQGGRAVRSAWVAPMAPSPLHGALTELLETIGKERLLGDEPPLALRNRDGRRSESADSHSAARKASS